MQVGALGHYDTWVLGRWGEDKKSTEKWAVWLEGNQEIVLVKKTFQEGGSEQVEQLWLREVRLDEN